MTQEYAALVGWDWADRKHDLRILETATGKEEGLVLEHKPKRINEWVCGMIAKYPGQRIAICLEQSCGPVVYALMGYPEIDLYPINPACFADYRKSFHNSGAKDDPTDAALLLDRLIRHPDTLKMFRPDKPETRLVAALCQYRRKAVDLRSSMCNIMRSTLKTYYPQALDLVGEELYNEMSCAFLMRWPDFQHLAATSQDKIRKVTTQVPARNGRAPE